MERTQDETLAEKHYGLIKLFFFSVDVAVKLAKEGAITLSFLQLLFQGSLIRVL